MGLLNFTAVVQKQPQTMDTEIQEKNRWWAGPSPRVSLPTPVGVLLRVASTLSTAQVCGVLPEYCTYIWLSPLKHLLGGKRKKSGLGDSLDWELLLKPGQAE